MGEIGGRRNEKGGDGLRNRGAQRETETETWREAPGEKGGGSGRNKELSGATESERPN